MSTRAIVIDGRCEGKGFFVSCDGYPAGLGIELKKVFTGNKSIEQVYQELINNRIEANRHFAQRTGLSIPVEMVVNSFQVLNADIVSVAKLYGADGLWERYRINVEYIYTLKHDGVYVKGLEVKRQRKVKEKETIRG
ncbi:hypothetical protein B9L19_03475 [Geobacillus thermocatenulatus]|uniref:Uncharacterized protein n=2 Tax=Geobacillus TaxID=129337 RepID=A0A226QB05_9BACL|nr:MULTISPECIES: hypothetical protein [Geobacillus]ASS98392.1 hypothetical protein GT3921_04610 [Geobacillus thermocatenulatus]MEB3752188.1 hypothetical protein [Geobacillus icigianus]OXB89154.1 hypothetical protein B9L19_03475 [Geobacillus thermocatenulatus]WJQ10077.1 hypothetical protein QT237_15380 [Geobacillus stearothermophilus]